MSQKEASRQKMKVVMVDPKEIKEPDVRITSTWDPELLEMFKGSIEADGIQQPLILIREGENLWLVDGKHRKDEALLQGIPKVPCVIMDGTMKQVMTRNLYMNRLRGGIKASEMIKVMRWLRDHEGMNSEQIQKETGLKRDYIEKLLECTKAVPEVLEALDREEIGVGHAWEIARVENKDVQLRLLAQVFQYRLSVKDLHNVVDDTLEILRKREEEAKNPQPPNPVLIPKIRCHGCEEEYPIKKVVGVNLCVNCYGLLVEAVREARKKGIMPEKPTQQQAENPTPPLETLTKDQSTDH
jgi:ParB-like chromosome segregation protein Spo0J